MFLLSVNQDNFKFVTQTCDKLKFTNTVKLF